MIRSRKWALLALASVSVVVLVLAGRAAISKQQAAALPVPPNPLDELFQKARPHVEAALSAQLDFAPSFRSVTSAQLLAAPDHDLQAFIHWHFQQLQGETLERTRRIAQQITDGATVARYIHPMDGSPEIIEVAMDNLAKIAGWDEQLAQVNSEAFLQLALVDGVVHWYLDKRFHIATLRERCRDAEEFDTLQAIVEGRAQAITCEVASKLGRSSLFPLLARRYVLVPDEAPDPGLKAVSQTALHARNRVCTEGMAFFDGLRRAGLRDLDGVVFSRLPRQRTMIAQPHCWVEALQRNQPDLAAVLKSLESALPASDLQVLQQTWTPEMLTQVASLLGAPRQQADKIAKTWYEGRSLIWTQPAYPDRQVALSVARHVDENGARAHFLFALELQRKQDTIAANSTCGPSMRVLESKSTPFILDGFAEAVLNERRIAIGDAGPVPSSLLLARAGNLVVECNWRGQTADAALAERLAQAVRVAAK